MINENTCSACNYHEALPQKISPIIRGSLERGFRWIKNPAAISPVWLEKPKRIAALAMLTVVGLLVYGLIQRQVRQYLAQHEASIPGNKGPTDIPTATVIFESFATVRRVELTLEDMTVSQIQGWKHTMS